MNPFAVAVCSILIGATTAPAVAIGQEPPKIGSDADPKAKELAPRQASPRREANFEQAMIEVNEWIGRNAGQVARPAEPARPQSTQTPVFPSKTMAKTPDALEVNYGLSLSDADEALRAQLEIPGDQGVVVIGVKAGSLAEHAGLKTNDVLLSLGDRPASDAASVREILLKLGKEALEVKLIREGKRSRMSLVGPEHGFPPEAAGYWIGVPVSPVDATLRAHLPILAPDAGLIVNDVVKGSPADAVEVRKNDILVALNGQLLKTSDNLIAQIQASKGNAVPLEVLRAGKPLTLTITPARRVHPTVINLMGAADGQVRYRVVRPNMAIEVAPRPDSAPGAAGAGADGKVEMKHLLSGQFVWALPETYYPLATAIPGTATAASPVAPKDGESLEATTARIEAQLKEILAKLDEFNRAVGAMKKSTER